MQLSREELLKAYAGVVRLTYRDQKITITGPNFSTQLRTVSSRWPPGPTPASGRPSTSPRCTVMADVDPGRSRQKAKCPPYFCWAAQP